MMKTLSHFLMAVAALLATFTLTGCEDEKIADTLEGAWTGNMYVTSSYGGQSYTASQSMLYFDKDPYEYATGTGYWVDYYSNAPWDYFSSRIEWKVENRQIQIYSVQEDQTYYISDYKLNGNTFVGYLYTNSRFSNSVYFELSRSSWNSYNDYNWNGYYYNSRYRSRAIQQQGTSETPRRTIGKQ